MNVEEAHADLKAQVVSALKVFYFAAPSRVLPDRWAVYDSDGTVARRRSRMAVFATREEAELFAEVANRRRRKVGQDCRHGAQGEPVDAATSRFMKQRRS